MNASTIFGWTFKQWAIVGVAPRMLHSALLGDQDCIDRLLDLQMQWEINHVFSPGESPLVNQDGKPLL